MINYTAGCATRGKSPFQKLENHQGQDWGGGLIFSSVSPFSGHETEKRGSVWAEHHWGVGGGGWSKVRDSGLHPSEVA